jgi:cytochrome c oxidase subunit 3
MQKGRRHLFHMVNPSARPFLIGVGAFFFTAGLVFYMNNVPHIFFSSEVFFIGLTILANTTIKWFLEIIRESTLMGYHCAVVQRGLKRGFILFIVSEIMLFFGFFWAFFHNGTNVDSILGGYFPPEGIIVINPFGIPLYNTFLLILSGISVTWTHKGIILYDLSVEVMDGFLVTIFLGWFFLALQVMEYYESFFNYNDSSYSCAFFMLTGLHGMHVFVGVVFLFVCFLRYIRGHFTKQHHLGFEFAVWYWHFVDVVWIFLYLTVYIWGSW